MRVLILCNPVAGGGRSMRMGESIAQHLRGTRIDAELLCTRLEPPDQWLDAALNGADALLIAGGDGAVRMAAGTACRTTTPIYHLACGTENLFAREFKMTCNADAVAGALRRMQTKRVDVGRVNGRRFVLMASVGFDAEVVHDLAASRGASISHWSYVRPIIRQLLRWRAAKLEVVVDGVRIDDGGPGFVVVGNSRQYGWRLNPAGRASMSDGLLDVAYFPARGFAGLARWAILSRAQRHLDRPGLRYGRGRVVSIRSDERLRYQVDGDPPHAVREWCDTDGCEFGSEDTDAQHEPWRLNIEVEPAALPVLLP